MDGVYLPQDYRASNRKQFTFYPRYSWCSFDRPGKDERLSRPWSHPAVLNMIPLDWNPAPWESSAYVYDWAINIYLEWIFTYFPVSIFWCQFSFFPKYDFFWTAVWSALGHSLRALNYKKIQNIKNKNGIFIFSKIKTM